jgi:hypothetical protein
MRGGLRRFRVIDVMQDIPESGILSHAGLTVSNPRCGTREIVFQEIIHTYNSQGQKIANNILIKHMIDAMYADEE